PTRFQQAAQRAALDQLHNEDQIVTSPERVVYCRDIGVIEPGLDPNLPQRAFGLLRRIGPATLEYLHRLQSLGEVMLNFKHSAHAATSQFFQDSVRADGFGDSDWKTHLPDQA